MDHSRCNQFVCRLGDGVYCPGPVGTAPDDVIAERQTLLAEKELIVDRILALEAREAGRSLARRYPAVAEASLTFELGDGYDLAAASERFVRVDGTVLDPDDVDEPFAAVIDYLTQESRRALWFRGRHDPAAGVMTIEPPR